MLVVAHRAVHDPETWRTFMAAAAASDQARLLSSTDRRSLELDASGFHELLLNVEGAIQREPAASLYWRLRHESEQTLRQAELDPALDVDEPDEGTSS